MTGRKRLEDILPIYHVFAETGWDSREQLLQLKEKYKYRNQYGKGITRTRQGFVLYLNIDGARTYCGTYKTIDEAKQSRTRIIQSDYKDIPVRRRKAYGGRAGHQKYIYKTRNGRYNINYMGESYGTFSTLEDAVEERDALIQCDWDYAELEAYEAGKEK